MSELRIDMKVVSVILLVLVIIFASTTIYYYNKNSNSSGGNPDFFNNYVIAMNDYHVAMEFFELGSANLDYGNDYTLTGEYYYDSAIMFYDRSREQLSDSKELLNHAELKINEIRDISPDQFYDTELDNREKQIDITMGLVDQYILLNDYVSKQLYEINYGSETEATRYYNLYNDLIKEVNLNMKELSDVSNDIDLAWDRDWYPLFASS